MAKPSLLCGNWVNPVAAIFLSLTLSAGLNGTRAYGEGDAPAAPASDEVKPAETRDDQKKPAGAVEESKPAPKAVEESKPAPKAVEESKPAPKAVEESKPAPKAVEESKPAPKAVEESKPAPKAVEESKPAPKAVEESKPAPKAVEEVPSQKPTQLNLPEKPAEAKKPAELKKPAETKEAKAEKPKDPSWTPNLMPTPEGPADLAVRASTVDAVYQISWLGAHIGDFSIKSSITTRQYSLQATADLSVFFGTFTWQGVTSSSGLMTANGPVPQNYSFRYATNDRRESIELKFQKRMVQDILINPPQFPGARRVPITAANLQNVVDPLSAIVLLSQARLNRGGEACNKRLPIFDGKIRFDLVLSPKGTRTVGNAGKLHGTAYVCSVHYVPIAGHKMGKNGENDYATGNTGIEVWLVPVPEAGLIVPYYIHVPTPAGTASMVTAKFDVQTPAGRHALAD